MRTARRRRRAGGFGSECRAVAPRAGPGGHPPRAIVHSSAIGDAVNSRKHADRSPSSRDFLAALRALVDATLGDGPPPAAAAGAFKALDCVRRRRRSRHATDAPTRRPRWQNSESSISASVRKKVRAIFDAMDQNGDGVVSRDEAVAFGALFGLSRSEAERRAASMLAAVDRDGDAVLDPAEWEAWFDSMLLHAASARRGAVVDHAALDEKFVETLSLSPVDGVLETASARGGRSSGAAGRAARSSRSRARSCCSAPRCSTSPPRAPPRRRPALAAHEAAMPLPGGAQGLIAFTAVVNAVGAFLSLVALAVPHAPPAERPRLLRSLGYASAVAMVLFLAAAAAQAVARTARRRRVQRSRAAAAARSRAAAEAAAAAWQDGRARRARWWRRSWRMRLRAHSAAAPRPSRSPCPTARPTPPCGSGL